MAVKGLVSAIVQFLTDQLQDGDITADSRESLEVAIQCLESAYNVQASDAPVNFNLHQVYRSAMDSAAPNLCPEATPEAKAEAERLKNEGNALMKQDKHHEALVNYTKYILERTVQGDAGVPTKSMILSDLQFSPKTT